MKIAREICETKESFENPVKIFVQSLSLSRAILLISFSQIFRHAEFRGFLFSSVDWIKQ